MATPSAQLTAVFSLAAVLSQIACKHAYQDGGDQGAGAGVSGGGMTATGGTGGLGGTGPSGVGATGATPPCPVYPDSSVCGEGGCEIGDSFPSGTGGGAGEECLFVAATGSTGGCSDEGAESGYCLAEFCQGGEWFAWRLSCPDP